MKKYSINQFSIVHGVTGYPYDFLDIISNFRVNLFV